jgi:hypothetical protein
MRRILTSLAVVAAVLAAPGMAFADGGSGGGGTTTVTQGTLAAVRVSPTTVIGGANATGTATFTAPMNDGAVLNIVSSDPTVAQVPAQSVVSARTSVGTFNVSTSAVAAPTQVTLTVTSFGVTQTATFTVAPGTLPAPDVVSIKKAEFKVQNNGGILSVEASSSNPDAILNVYTRDGILLFKLTNNAGGTWTGSKAFLQNPNGVVVQSNFGGSATAST